MSQVQLSKEGLSAWKDVFPDGKVPVCELGFHPKSVHVGNEEYVLINFKALSEKQKIAIIRKISDRARTPRTEVCDAIEHDGLPLRKSLTTGVVSTPLRYFI